MGGDRGGCAAGEGGNDVRNAAQHSGETQKNGEEVMEYISSGFSVLNKKLLFLFV